MKINEIKTKADGDYVDSVQGSIGRVEQKQSKAGNTFYKATLEDDTGKIGITFFNDKIHGLDHKHISISGKGIKIENHERYGYGLCVFSDAGILEVNGASEPLGEKVQNQVPASQGDFHQRLGRKAGLYGWCLLYGHELRSRARVPMTDEHFQGMVSSLFIEANKCDLAHISPRMDWDHFKHPSLKEQPEEPPAEPEPSSAPDSEPDGPTEAEKRQEAARKAKEELQDIDDLDEDEIPF